MDSKRDFGLRGADIGTASHKKRSKHKESSVNEEQSQHDQSQRDLFYSALSNKHGTNKGRPRIGNGGLNSGIGTYSSGNSN